MMAKSFKHINKLQPILANKALSSLVLGGKPHISVRQPPKLKQVLVNKTGKSNHHRTSKKKLEVCSPALPGLRYMLHSPVMPLCVEKTEINFMQNN